MSFSRSYTMNAYPRLGFIFFFGLSPSWVFVTIRIFVTVLARVLQVLLRCNTYPLNRSESPKLPLEILVSSIIAQPSNE